MAYAFFMLVTAFVLQVVIFGNAGVKKPRPLPDKCPPFGFGAERPTSAPPPRVRKKSC